MSYAYLQALLTHQKKFHEKKCAINPSNEGVGSTSTSIPSLCDDGESETSPEETPSPSITVSSTGALINKPFTCSNEGCDKSFVHYQGIRRHEKQCKFGPNYTAPILISPCISRPGQPSAKTKISPRHQECTICGSFVINLKNHIRVHTGNYAHTCSVCGKGFIEKSRLEEHVLMHEVDTSLVKI